MRHPATSAERRTTTKSRRTRAFGLAFASAVVLAAAVYAAWWKVVADGLRDGIDRWRIEREAAGLAVRWAGTTVAGFPNDIVVTILEPSVGVPGRWSWQGETLDLSISPLALDVVRFRADGNHSIEDRRDDRDRRWDIAADTLRGTARGNLNAGAIAVEMAGATVTENGRSLAVVRSLSAELERPPRPATPEPEALTPPVAYELTVGLTAEDVSGAIDWPSGDTVQVVDARLVLHGDVGLPLTRDSVVPWRDAGGVLDLEALSARSGPLALSGSGTLSLDAGLQPVGALSLSLEGYGEIVDWLVGRGNVQAGDAATIKALLSLLARGNGAGGDTLSAALTVQDGKVYLGPFELGDVPPVRWPD